jgi:alkaline phosphatase D
MILDDHEIEDNWSQDRLDNALSRELFNLAIGAYMSYQWSHGPRNYGRMLYYDFEHAGYPFFVLDTRTHRYRDRPGIGDNHLLGRPTRDPAYPSQLDRLLAWLGAQQAMRGDVPKFIVSSSVFVPSAIVERWDKTVEDENLAKREDSDSWPAFPKTRTALLRYIVENTIQNVVFLSGDIHCSNIAELWFERRASARSRKIRRLPLVMYSITSSAFYWPFPFADGDPNNYVHDSTDQPGGQYDGFDVGDGVTMHYRARAFTQEDNFCRIDIDPAAARLRVRVFNDRGQPVRVRPDDRDGRSPPLDNELQLAPWT